MDIFGVDLPTFNIKGESKVATVTGGLLSFFVGVVFFIYGTLKLSHLMDKYNPNISEVKETNVYTTDTRLNLNDIGFRIAFAVEGYVDQELRDDHRYVKYLARIYTYSAGEETEKFVPFGKCTDD